MPLATHAFSTYKIAFRLSVPGTRALDKLLLFALLPFVVFALNELLFFGFGCCIVVIVFIVGFEITEAPQGESCKRAIRPM